MKPQGPVIASRRLQYSEKGGDHRHPFSILVRAPVPVRQEDVSFQVGSGLYVCRVEFEGVAALSHDYYGMDGIQALALAIDVDAPLRWFASDRFDLFYEDGEPYSPTGD